MFNIVSKSWSFSFSGGSIATAPPSLNFCMQLCIVLYRFCEVHEELHGYTYIYSTCTTNRQEHQSKLHGTLNNMYVHTYYTSNTGNTSNTVNTDYMCMLEMI